ncbi:MAG TPA: universal stress protein [Thermoleophilaceae bacterium]|nr:universal stress protein [Thermoleophilaceae bacterium]
MTTSGTILCGVNGSRGARDALQLARALSERLGLRLVVAHVARDPERVAAGERLLAEIADGAAGGGPPQVRLATGDRASRLAEIAGEEGADLIIIGSPSGRRRRLGRRGALARELESATSCPVLIAPRQTRPRSEVRLARAQAVGTS